MSPDAPSSTQNPSDTSSGIPSAQPVASSPEHLPSDALSAPLSSSQPSISLDLTEGEKNLLSESLNTETVSPVQSETTTSNVASTIPIDTPANPVMPEPAITSTPASVPATPPPAKSASRMPLYLVIIGFLIAILGVGIYYGLNTFQKKLEQNTQAEASIPGLIKPEKIIIANDSTYPPMEYLDEKGELMGYDIDLGKRIAEKMNLQPEFKSIVWDDIFNALNRKEVDIVISSVSITDERKLEFDFSEPYLNAGQVIITQKTNTDIKSPEDLRGKRIAVQKGTTNEQNALNFTEPEKVIAFEDFIEATNALLRGDADAVTSDLTNAKGIVSDHPELKISSDPFTSEYYGIVFRKGDKDLVNRVNQALDVLRQQGVLVYLKQKWLE